MHYAVANRVDIGEALNLGYSRLFGREPADHMAERGRNIAEGSGRYQARALGGLKCYDGLTADPFHLPAAEALILVFLDSLQVSGNDLEFQAGTTGVQDESIHWALLWDGCNCSGLPAPGER